MKNIQRIEDIREGIAEGDVFIREDFIGCVSIAFVHTVIGGDGQPAKTVGKYHLVEAAPSGGVMSSRSYRDALDWLCAIEARGPLTSWSSRVSDISRRDLVGSEHADDARIIRYEDVEGVDYRVEFFPRCRAAELLKKGDRLQGTGNQVAEVLEIGRVDGTDTIRATIAPVFSDGVDHSWARKVDYTVGDSIELHTPLTD